MSNDENRVFSFVKGHEGLGACMIVNNQNRELYSVVVPYKDEQNNPLKPCLSDQKIIEHCLEYIRDSPKDFPNDPIIFLFTTFENNFKLASGINKPSEPSSVKFCQRIDSLKKDLQRAKKGKDHNLKILFIPNNFTNKMEDLKEKFNAFKTKNVKYE